MKEKKSGIVTIVGRPSAGKSTFLNTVCGGKVSIVSPVPQTTRCSIRGIFNSGSGQIVFIDTPGYHISEKKLNLKLKEITENRLKDAEVILYLADSSRLFGEEELAICRLLKPFQKRLVIAVNKTDLKEAKPGLTLLSIQKELPEVPPSNIFNISAEKNISVSSVLDALMNLLPEGSPFYPPEFYTDQDVAFRITEIIRGQAILHTREEIPHAIYVSVQDMEMKKQGKELHVRCFLNTERESQKRMIIGKGGCLIKSIKADALKELRNIFPYKVILDIQVRVDKNWRQKDKVIKSISAY